MSGYLKQRGDGVIGIGPGHLQSESWAPAQGFELHGGSVYIFS
jgi:hypothetical protein